MFVTTKGFFHNYTAFHRKKGKGFVRLRLVLGGVAPSTVLYDVNQLAQKDVEAYGSGSLHVLVIAGKW